MQNRDYLFLLHVKIYCFLFKKLFWLDFLMISCNWWCAFFKLNILLLIWHELFIWQSFSCVKLIVNQIHEWAIRTFISNVDIIDEIGYSIDAMYLNFTWEQIIYPRDFSIDSWDLIKSVFFHHFRFLIDNLESWTGTRSLVYSIKEE